MRSAASPVGRYAHLLRDTALPVTAGVTAGLAYLLVYRSLIDDSYITMSYARNVAFHLHWGLLPAETANSATSPLNVLLLAAITVVIRDVLAAVGVLFVASVVLAAHWLAEISRQFGASRATPWIGTALLLANPLLLSTVGLESYLAASLFIGLLRYGAAGRAVAFGIAAGLAVLTRPDLGVVVVVAVFGFPAVRRSLLKAVTATVAVTAPWHLFSWFALGSALPDTLLVKAGQGTWSGYGFATGPLMYLVSWPAAAAASFLPVLLGVVALVLVLLDVRAGRRGGVQRTAAVAATAAAAHYAAYGILGTPPYHWYYAPLIVGMSLCTALVVGHALARRRAGASFAAAATVVLALSMAAIDLLHGMPWTRAAISTNWASPAEYERIGTEMRPLVGAGAVQSPGEIGTLAHHCRCTVVDVFSDRGRMIDMIEAREARSGPVVRAFIRLNYLHLDRADQPYPVTHRLVFEADPAPAAPDGWPARHWAEGPGRVVLRAL